MLRGRLRFSERRACRLAGQHRSTQRHEPPVPTAEDRDLRAELRRIARRKPRWGYRRAHGHLRSNGHVVNRKRVQRLWREEGLRVPQKTRKRRRTGDREAQWLRAERPNELWAIDYQYDQTADGRMLRLLNIVDEFTREALAIRVGRSITADETVTVLDGLVAERGGPQNLRCDNGPELTAHALRGWCASAGVTTRYIEPGSPWQNPFAESFNARVRDELAQPRGVLLPRRGAGPRRGLAPTIQRRASTLRPRIPLPGRVRCRLDHFHGLTPPRRSHRARTPAARPSGLRDGSPSAKAPTVPSGYHPATLTRGGPTTGVRSIPS
jgi:putative transposase